MSKIINFFTETKWILVQSHYWDFDLSTTTARVNDPEDTYRIILEAVHDFFDIMKESHVFDEDEGDFLGMKVERGTKFVEYQSLSDFKKALKLLSTQNIFIYLDLAMSRQGDWNGSSTYTLQDTDNMRKWN